MIFHGKLTLTNSSQSLSGAIAVQTGPICWLSLQADGGNTAIMYFGGSQSGAVSSTTYGFRIEAPVSSIPNAPSIFEFPRGMMSLADLNVIGTTNDIVHVTVITV